MLSTQPRIRPSHAFAPSLSFTLASAAAGCVTRNRRT